MTQISLISEQWIPVRDRKGVVRKISPLEILDEEIVDIAAERADFQTALWQFLIGLIQTTLAPEDEDAWFDIWEEGLEKADLAKAFSKVGPAFIFGPQSPSFMQDFDQLEGEAVPLAALLPESPGENTIKHNKDFFIKRGEKRFCPHCAAMALFSLQLNAPSGGQGYRTGLRGGGPLTTLIELHSYKGDRNVPLWRKLWANVMPEFESNLPVPKEFDAAVFPWMGKTRTSKAKGSETTPEQVNPLQAYWGMPRRVRIDFEDLEEGRCDFCGEESDQLLSKMKVQNYGINYSGWVHPLTPYRCKLKTPGELNSVKLQPGGLVWKDWLGLNEETTRKDTKEIPALVVETLKHHIGTETKHGLWGFGYDFDNMKVRCWYEHHLPQLLSKEMQSSLQVAQDKAARTLLGLKRAFSKLNRECSYLDVEFWNLTQNLFLGLIRELDEKNSDSESLSAFIKNINRFALIFFDDRTFSSQMNPKDYKECSEARKNLLASLYAKSRSTPKEAK